VRLLKHETERDLSSSVFLILLIVVLPTASHITMVAPKKISLRVSVSIGWSAINVGKKTLRSSSSDTKWTAIST
jgi:hypothetical protein